jgi:hypothetical protein
VVELRRPQPEEVASYAAAWAAADERFGTVATSLDRIPAPPL